nr:hypothetical protein MACL_00000275 [Theileria orientalis]
METNQLSQNTLYYYWYFLDDIDSPGAAKHQLGKTLNRLFLTHVGSNDLVLFFILLATAGVIWAVSERLAGALCFIAGALTSLVLGLVAIFVSRRTASKLVNLAHGGVRRVYNRSMGNASALVVFSLGLNALVILAISCALTFRETQLSKITLSLKAISFFSFGSLVVTLYSRTSGGLYNNAFSILSQSDLEHEDENRPIFDSMNAFLQNIYELILEVVAIVSVLFCTYFLVIGGFSDGADLVANHFGHLNFPVLVLAFSMAVSVIFIFIFGFIMRNNSMKLVKRSFFYITGCSSLLIIILMPMFHAFFTPKDLKAISYNRFVNYGLVISGSFSAILIAFSGYFFLSSYTRPGRSVNLSVLTSLTGGLVNSLSFSKLLCFVPTATVCFNLFICVLCSDVYALLYVATGFLCLLTMVVIGSVFYSLMVSSSKFAKYCNYDDDVTQMFTSFRRSWYDINAIVRPFLSTMSILIGLVLLSHLYHSLKLKAYSHFHPLVMMSLLIGCLFPVFQSGLILRISSGIANWRLKKQGYLRLLNELYLDGADDDDHDDRGMADTYERNQRILNKLKFWKRFGSNKKPKGSGSGQNQSSNEGDAPQSDNAGLPQDDSEVVVRVHGETSNYRTFGRAFKACLLREAGVREDVLMNAPIMCSSARSTHQDYLTPNLALHANSNHQNNIGANGAAVQAVENTKTLTTQDLNTSDVGNALGVHKHGSRDYRILKNADNHYRMFHPKYHDKHFNLRKKSKVAGGDLEELQSLLSKDSEVVDETNETSIYCPSYELSDGVNSEVDGESGDSLDKVYRRSEDMAKDVARSVNIHYYNQSSCGSSCAERESASFLKVVQHDQVHTREPESDSESKNKGNRNESNPGETAHHKRGSNEGRRRFVRPIRRSRGRTRPTEVRSDEVSAPKETATEPSEPTEPSSSSSGSRELPVPGDLDLLTRLSRSFGEPGDASSRHDTPLSDNYPVPKLEPMSKESAPLSEKKGPAAPSGEETPLAPTARNTPVSGSSSEAPASESPKVADSVLSGSESHTSESMGVLSSSSKNDSAPAHPASETDVSPAPFEASDNDDDFARELNIRIQQNLIPPDVGISDQPRRPTPKCIELPVLADLEAALSSNVKSTTGSGRASNLKASSFHNTLTSIFLSLLPFIFSLGFPMLFGVVFGSISISVMALFSTLSSSLLVQLMTFCSTSWESTLLFMRSKRDRDDIKGRDHLINDADFKNGQSVSMIGRITLCSVGPVLNTLVIAIPLLCVLAADQFNSFSNAHGFPRWSKIES